MLHLEWSIACARADEQTFPLYRLKMSDIRFSEKKVLKAELQIFKNLISSKSFLAKLTKWQF
ncbi:hypothetical protein CYCD_13230 [Tenuifilaceae bacterium CYCD]|nr:hypothetical protein CYCD_13230 [Tenuifilaceae bacterium CYCD]